MITATEQAEYARRTAPDRADGDAMDAMRDPLWRVANLYDILHPKRGVIPFRPNVEQVEVLVALFIRGWQRILLPKARQLGMSTLLCVVGVDLAAFNDGWRGALIDKTMEDAKAKLKDKAWLAWDRLPEACRAGVKGTQFTEKLVFSGGSDTESTFSAAVSVRGGALNWAHISEWGEIQNKRREVSREIASGTIPAVELAGDSGFLIVETTWSCGLDGELGALAKAAMDTPDEAKGPASWRIVFFSWIGRVEYEQDHGYIDSESADYFGKLERQGIALSKRQKLWYSEKRRQLGSRDMRSQYPSVLAECFETVPEGSIYGDWIERARAQGRIHPSIPVQSGRPVHTFWDLGHPANTVCWYVQPVGLVWHVIDCDIDLDITIGDRIARMMAKGYSLGWHFLPHDGEQAASDATSTKQRFEEAGLRNILTIPRTTDIWAGIDATRSIFERFHFDEGRCKLALERLGRYYSVTHSSSGQAALRPVHDINSHAADAFRQIGQAVERGMISDTGVVGSAPRPNGPPQAMMGIRQATAYQGAAKALTGMKR